MDFYLLVSTITLALQLTAFALLIIGYNLKRQNKFRQHGVFMFTAVILHIITVLIIMVPSFGVIAFTTTGLPETVVAFSVIHAIFGLTALVLGVWIAFSWRFRQSLAYCMPKKRFMLVTFTAWIIAIFLGSALYFILYMPLMV
jgi:uncharacterized membrane protein YozB (DUF420 family)